LNGDLEPMPMGVTGELYIGGDGLARAYLGESGLTAERFMPDPLGEAGKRLYRTGDLGRQGCDGSIEFLGRTDWQVKVRGYRVEPGEIEAVLNQHRSVRQSLVLAGEDQRGGPRLLGYVVGTDGVTAQSLKSHAQEKLPEYMVPEAIMVLEELPVTANGKIDRKRLLALAEARQPMERCLVAPRDVLEFQLLQIWESVLSIHPISVTDNFFELGGHSILAMSLMARIQKAVGRELPLSALFQGGTIERLAAILRRDAGSMSWSCLVELQSSGSRPPLFFVHPGGGGVLCYFDLARHLGPDQPVYGLQLPGYYGERSLYTRIEDLAAHYVEAIRAAQPEGPYFLGGWSLGGIIAYEMAQQLTAQGQSVGQVLIFDSGIRSGGEEDLKADEGNIEADDAEILMETLKAHLPISIEEVQQFQGDERIDYILEKAKSANLLPPDIGAPQARHLQTVLRTNLRALGQYVPQVYPGAVTLFKTAQQLILPPSDESARAEHLTDRLQDPTMGWGELAAGGVRIIESPGEHATMMSNPHVEILALRIKDYLDEVRTTPE
jgi:thioesterase domain-containing protein/acyl carrier protein